MSRRALLWGLLLSWTCPAMPVAAAGWAEGQLYREPVDCGPSGCLLRETGRAALGQALRGMVRVNSADGPGWSRLGIDLVLELSDGTISHLTLELPGSHVNAAIDASGGVSVSYLELADDGVWRADQVRGWVSLPKWWFDSYQAPCACDDGALELLLLGAGADGQLGTADDEERRLSEVLLSWSGGPFCRQAQRHLLPPALEADFFSSASCPVAVAQDGTEDQGEEGQAVYDPRGERWGDYGEDGRGTGELLAYSDYYEPGGCELPEPEEDDSWYEEDAGGCGGEDSGWADSSWEEDSGGCAADSGGWEEDSAGDAWSEDGGCAGDSGGGWEEDSGGGCEGDTVDDGWSSGGGGCEGDTVDEGWSAASGSAAARSAVLRAAVAGSGSRGRPQPRRRLRAWQRQLGGLLPLGIFAGFLGISRRRRGSGALNP